MPRVTLRQTTLDVRLDERVGDALSRIRRDASSEAEKGRWFEHLFMATVRDNAEFDVAACADGRLGGATFLQRL